MLALLPPGEPEGMLFKTHFINRLPVTIQDHVVTARATASTTQWRQRSSAKGSKSQGKLCYSHQKYGDQMWKCADPRTCTWLGNE